MEGPGPGEGEPTRSRSIAVRVLAPVALIAVAVALVTVIGSSTGSDDTGREPRGQSGPGRQAGPGGGNRSRPPQTYAVEPGDTLSGIAERFGVSDQRIRRLNPDVDPQALATGQELRLRR